MVSLKMEMVLTGPLTGKTLLINRHSFKSGVAHIVVEPIAMDAFLTFMARSCQAYPQGSEELKYAQERDKASGLFSDLQANTEATDGAPAPVQSVGDNGSRQVPGSRALQSDGHAEDQAGGKGLVSGGDRHENAGVGDRVESRTNEQSDALMQRIAVAVLKLDPTLDDHWTSDKLPSVSVIADAVGDQKITREMIDAAAPEWNREKAEDAAAL